MQALLGLFLGIGGLAGAMGSGGTSETSSKAAPARSDNIIPPTPANVEGANLDISEEPEPDEQVVWEPPAPVIDDTEGAQSIEATLLPSDGGILAVSGGRVARLAVDENEDNISSVRVIDGPEHGNLTVNPDNTLALVLSTSSYTGPLNFTYEVTHTDGSTSTSEAQISVEPGSQEAGWGMGRHYKLATDENDNSIIETGDDHRKVFVSDSDDALSRADIAYLEGVDINVIDGKWLADHATYGADEEMALKPDVGMELWYSVTGETTGRNSNWLLFEKGYEYNDLGQIVTRGMSGEDELHPAHITSWGDEDKAAIINTPIEIWQRDSDDIVISNLELHGGVRALTGSDILFENIEATNAGFGLQYMESVTIRNSDFQDMFSTEPNPIAEDWAPHANRVAGLYSAYTEGLLIENTLFAQIGWEEGFDHDGDGDLPQPPSMFSHNIYLHDNTTDVTFRDNITTESSSFGAQLRGGAYIEDNLFFENNAQVSFWGGNFDDNGAEGNYTLFTDNVMTSASYKTAYLIGAVSAGVINGGVDTTMLNNILTHLSDPNNPSELDYKEFNNGDLIYEEDPFFDDTIVYNWAGSRDYDLNQAEANHQNVEGLDTDVLNNTTIQNIASYLTGNPGTTVSEFADFLKDSDITADEIISYFQNGFSIEQVETVGTGETFTFVPNALSGGIRWDNRLNWDLETLPGTAEDQNVDLGGNWVNYAGTTTINDISYGDGGILNVAQGKLTVDGQSNAGDDGAELNISAAGQYWSNGHSGEGQLNIDVDGGRFANTGQLDGNINLDVSSHGDALLATDDASLTLQDGDTLNIFGSSADVGFEGVSDGTGTLHLSEGATLHFSASDNGFSTIEEFRSGAFDQETPAIQSGVNLGLGTLELDIRELGADASDHLLIDVDALVGEFSDIRLLGLGDDRDADLEINYDSDTVMLHLGAAGEGAGQFSLTNVGDAEDASDGAELWDALTNGQGTFTDDQPTELSLEDELFDEVV